MSDGVSSGCNLGGDHFTDLIVLLRKYWTKEQVFYECIYNYKVN